MIYDWVAQCILSFLDFLLPKPFWPWKLISIEFGLTKQGLPSAVSNPFYDFEKFLKLRDLLELQVGCVLSWLEQGDWLPLEFLYIFIMFYDGFHFDVFFGRKLHLLLKFWDFLSTFCDWYEISWTKKFKNS